jgi:flavin reductase (DIM6/NTAB) family NADH-FMN oxidoreductase RutF
MPNNFEHKTIRPPVLYVGTPVVLITTCNQDGTANISPMSSAWALGDRFVLGMSSSSQCHENTLREMECVLNFPSASLWPSVESIARSTGRESGASA